MQPDPKTASPPSAGPGAQPQFLPVYIERRPESFWSRPGRWLLRGLLVASLVVNVYFAAAYHEYFAAVDGSEERFHSGSEFAPDKLAIIHVTGTIMPPFTSHVLKSIKQARDDEAVKGVLLVVDSPGGLVTDSHQIYHDLAELRQKKPVVVSMRSMAASGGYYVAMGAGREGKIFAEPTTWTGSIGVIIPRYEFKELAEKLGVHSKPLKTGEFKDALSPFRDLSEREAEIWNNILQQSFERFLKVIADNRPKLDLFFFNYMATWEIYTADDALENGLIDAIGYEEDALQELKQQTQLKDARVVTYHSPPALLDLVLGSAQARDPLAPWKAMLESTVPRAMYFCSWGAPLPGGW
jgi:protease-4